MTEADVDFAEQYFYKTSTANQQIKAWWSQLTKSQMYHWQVCLSFAWIVQLCLCWYTFQNYFIELTDDGLYNHSHLKDWIVFLTVYMSIIQQEIFKFIQLWNNHTVQQQRNWLNAVTDKSIMLYHYSATVSAEDYKTPISQDVLNEVETLFNDWGMFCMFSVFIQKLINRSQQISFCYNSQLMCCTAADSECWSTKCWCRRCIFWWRKATLHHLSSAVNNHTITSRAADEVNTIRAD
jgi:hypothetical protein